VCTLIQISEAHFSRSFKRTFGEPPHALVIWRRVELAARCMLQTDASLSDIAQRFGFTDQAHLCKKSRQVMGEAPAAWRRAQRSQQNTNGMVRVSRVTTDGAPARPIGLGATVHPFESSSRVPTVLRSALNSQSADRCWHNESTATVGELIALVGMAVCAGASGILPAADAGAMPASRRTTLRWRLKGLFPKATGYLVACTVTLATLIILGGGAAMFVREVFEHARL
jgi:hypothetical protein